MEWAVRGGSDYLIGETFNDFGEAKLALDVMKTHGNGKKTPESVTLLDKLIYIFHLNAGIILAVTV